MAIRIGILEIEESLTLHEIKKRQPCKADASKLPGGGGGGSNSPSIERLPEYPTSLVSSICLA